MKNIEKYTEIVKIAIEVLETLDFNYSYNCNQKQLTELEKERRIEAFKQEEALQK